MIYKYFLFLVVVGNVTFSFQQSLAEKYQYYFSKDTLKRHLSILTADSLTGRYTGTKGQQKAAAYIKNQFEQNHIEPLFKSGYYQPFSIAHIEPSGNLMMNNYRLDYYNDYLFFDTEVSSKLPSTEVFYFSEDIKQKHAISSEDKFILLTKKEVEDYDNEKLRELFNRYKKEKARGIIYATPTFDEVKREMKKELTRKQFMLMDQLSRELDFPLFFVKEEFIDHLVFEKNKWDRKFKKDRKIKKPLYVGQISGNLNPKVKSIHTENVGGIIKANNFDDNKDHLVVLGHYDHLGIRAGDIYRGADDNGSGIASILEVARMFGLAKKEGIDFDRSIVFLAVSAEEIGLLGSAFYTLNPVLPLKNTNAVLNIDMVGRENLDTLDTYSLFLIGADKINKELHDTNEKINSKHFNLHLDYRYNEEDHDMRLYYRSDHYNFVKHNIPSVFYFGGFHEDYHKPTDTADKIDFQKLQKVSKFFFFTAWEIATQPELLKR